MVDTDPTDFLVSFVLSLIFLALSWGWARTVRRGQPMTRVQKLMLLYSYLFALGMSECMAGHKYLANWFHWERAWIAAIIIWAMVIAAVAWLRHRSPSGLS
jgi:hypothetical protein